jgi:hypothetical protein
MRDMTERDRSLSLQRLRDLVPEDNHSRPQLRKPAKLQQLGFDDGEQSLDDQNACGICGDDYLSRNHHQGF